MRDAQIGPPNRPRGTASAIATLGGAAHPQLTLDAHGTVISNYGSRPLMTDFCLANDIASFMGRTDTPTAMG
jgi:hypothetical protein